jgi:hypothetical protein
MTHSALRIWELPLLFLISADYLIAVKGNLQRLYDSIKQAFACANKTSTLHMEKGHGRVGAFEYHVLDGVYIAKAFP